MGSRLEKRSTEVRKRIENHTFDHEEGDEYEGSAFGGFGDYFRRKKIKLQNLDANLRSQTADNPPIFRGIVVHVNGYTQPSLNDLHKLVVSHHGGFLQYLDGKTMVTHVVASNLTPKKAIEFRKYRVVKPAWIVESVKAGRLLPWNLYRVVDEGPKQKVLGFDAGQLINRKTEFNSSYRDQTDASWYTKNLNNFAIDRTSSQVPKTTESTSFSELDDDIFDAVETKSKEQSPLLPTSPPVAHQASPSPKASDEYANLSFSRFDQIDENISTRRDEQTNVQLKEDLPSPALKDAEKRPTEETNESPSKRRKLTAEEHNTVLLADPEIRKFTVVNPGFLEQYYRESRLHHLSSWKADLKSEMQALADQKSSSQKARQKRPSEARRYILHVDFDCFFAAVSLKKLPQYKDRPVVVAHGQGSGSEIASCNYAARKFGVKNGMWMKKAQELCSDLKILPYDFPAYEEASRGFYEKIIATGGIVQSVSVDEALLDITSLVLAAVGSGGVRRAEGAVDREQQAANKISLKLREDIKNITGCDVSVGIGGNILLAKLALRKAKPAGQYQVLPEDILDFIGELEVQNLPGVAYNIGGKLEQLGITYVKDIREVSKEKLINTLGPKTGDKMWEYARGVDRKEVGDVEIRKSVSAEVNWGVRFENQEQVDDFIGNLCGEVHRRLLKEGVKGKQLTLKIMRRSADAPLDPPKHLGHGLCDTYNKSMALGVATNQADILTRETLAILKSFHIPPGELRGIGVQVTKLELVKPSGADLGSQKMLQFKRPSVLKTNDSVEDPIEDAVVTPKKPKDTPGRFGADQLNQLTPSRKLLNTMGTQFILPTQADPKVLSELPSGIRSKLVKSSTKTPIKPEVPASKARTDRLDGFPDIFTALPSRSQIDPDILNALPAEMQEEILAFYNNTPSAVSRPMEQDFDIHKAARSPRHDSVGKSPSKPKPAPIQRRGRGRPPKTVSSAQTNFITSHFLRTTPDPTSGSDTPISRPNVPKPHRQPSTKTKQQPPPVQPLIPAIDPTYLAALPPDLRAEAILFHQQEAIRLKNLAIKTASREAASKARLPKAPRKPAKIRTRPKPSFTTAKLSRVQDLRATVAAWVEEFREEGPYGEDVEALGMYLGRVVTEEGNMEKAVAVVRWFEWVLDETEFEEDDEGGEAWRKAYERIGECVQQAVKGRKIGRVKL